MHAMNYEVVVRPARPRNEEDGVDDIVIRPWWLEFRVVIQEFRVVFTEFEVVIKEFGVVIQESEVVIKEFRVVIKVREALILLGFWVPKTSIKQVENKGKTS